MATLIVLMAVAPVLLLLFPLLVMLYWRFQARATLAVVLPAWLAAFFMME
jgi:hypothetical protein